MADAVQHLANTTKSDNFTMCPEPCGHCKGELHSSGQTVLINAHGIDRFHRRHGQMSHDAVSAISFHMGSG
jgi:hypothetical protein